MRRAVLLALPVALGAAAAPGRAPAPDPVPQQGAFVVLEPVSGEVSVRPADVTRYGALTGPRRLPVGVTVDAQEGAVRLTVARPGGTSSAVFSLGKFTVLQEAGADPVATLRLTGPSYADVCEPAAAAGKRKAKRVRRLWGDGKGAFRTSGRYSAATVRGTRWLTEDRCDGTLTRVVRGEVSVEDFTLPERPPDPPVSPPAPAPVEGGTPDSGASEPPGGDDVTLAAGERYVAGP